MKTKIRKTISMMLAVLMLVVVFPIHAFAAEEEITVSFTAFDGSVIFNVSEMKVYDNIAEEYGYVVKTADHNGNEIDEVTIFDVIVAAHKEYYGDAFTPETAQKYLVMNSSFITKAFGKSAASSGFLVNDLTPNDGIYNESYGSYTSYSCDTAELRPNDDVTYFFYQDTTYWMDYKTVFADDTITATAGDEVTVNVSAFCIWYGSATSETLASMTVPADGVDIYSVDGAKLATTDVNGNATLTFTEAGEYKIYTTGTIASSGAPAIIDWATVTVNDSIEEEPSSDDSDDCSFFSLLWNLIKKIVSFPVKLVKDIIDWLF